MKNYIENNFGGAIKGSKIYDFSRDLDYKLNTNERLELVENIFIQSSKAKVLILLIYSLLTGHKYVLKTSKVSNYLK